ncbi:MAG: RNA polymerase sigma factor [Bacteroidota bacterium]|nr:RNA polymerase sigma factor [Bacteroidota bacterium]MDP4206147.1 RNA polymerase sigma factor [Bacteroidota bacterium]
MTLEEFNRCVDEYADSLFRFALKSLRDEDKARDAVQECYARLWSNHKQVNGEKVKSYLFTSAYHLIIDSSRKEKREPLLDPAKAPERAHCSQYSDLKEVLNEAIQRLPEIQRTVILLRDYEGYSYQEIGEMCSLSEAQVKIYIYRGRVFLKNYIGHMEVLI